MSDRCKYLKGFPFIKQMPNCCGPASLAMVLQYYGFNASQHEIANFVENRCANGCEPSRLVKIIESPYNLAYDMKTDSDIEDIKGILDRDIPPIVLTQRILDSWGLVDHYEIAIGYNDICKRLTLQCPTRGLYHCDYQEFMHYWSDKKIRNRRGYDNLMIVVYPDPLLKF